MSFLDKVFTLGEDGSLPAPADYIGVASPKSGVYLLDAIRDLALLGAPGTTDTTAQQALIAYAEGRKNLTVFLDMPAALLTEDAMAAYVEAELGSQSSFAQLFAPWGMQKDPRPGARISDRITVPPVAAALGLTVAAGRRGAHISGANQLINWTDVLVDFSPEEHTRLNDGHGISIIRNVEGTGLRLFGDRTLDFRATDGRKFGTVRRWLCYFYRTVLANFVDFPFKPATRGTMEELQDRLNAFLATEWERGALYPDDSASEAFLAVCDETTTTEENLGNGELVALVRVSPVGAFEKIIFQVESSVGGIRISE